jgi:Ser/Thr protein kinase RdoA (MazF antagonist)
MLSAAHLAHYVGDAYGLQQPVSCAIIRAGVNDTYSVRYAGGRYVLRVYSFGWRTHTEIEEELRLLLALRDAGIRVSYPVADATGGYVQILDAPEGQRYAVLFSFAPGDKIHNFTPEQHYNAGMAIAQLHKVTEGFSLNRTNYTAATVLTEPMADIAAFFTKPCAELEFLDSTCKILLNEWAKADITQLRTGALHLDMWFDNMNVDETGQPTIFDFDFCGNGWLCADVAYYMLQLYYVERVDTECQIKLQAFLQGYESVTPLTTEEKRLLPMLGVSLYYFYLGVQCRRFHNWSNVFLSETYLKRFIIAIVKRYYDIHFPSELPV